MAMLEDDERLFGLLLVMMLLLLWDWMLELEGWKKDDEEIMF